MTLAFKTKIEGKPTHFIEKIWEAVLRNGVECNARDLAIKLQESMVMIGNYTIGTYTAKLHTIREDKSNRWKSGNNIHCVINNRTPERFQFAPVIKCMSTQEFQVSYKYDGNKTTAKVLVEKKIIGEAIWVNCQLKNSSFTVDKLALNDGFENTNDFFEWFSEDFKGKIIHWTNIKY